MEYMAFALLRYYAIYLVGYNISGRPVDLTFMGQAVKEELLDLFYFKFQLKVGPTDLPAANLLYIPSEKTECLDGIAAETCRLAW